MTDVYKDNGYENRKQYLQSLAGDYGVTYGKVKMLADMLGENDDFDGLITELEDMIDSADFDEDEDEE